ncbi:MAG: DUF6088 family protein [Synergistaceae bacterium]
MEYRGYGKFLAERIARERYGTAIFADDFAVDLTSQFAIPLEHAKKVVNVNLKRLADRGIIQRLKAGIYYKAKETAFGKTKPNIDAVMTRVLTINDEEIIGYETGVSFQNSIGLITLMPKIKEIATNRYRIKLDPNCNIAVRKPKTKINKDNYKYLQFIDLIDELPTAYIDAADPYLLLNGYINKQELDKLKLISIAKKYYPNKTLLRLLDVLFEVEYETA